MTIPVDVAKVQLAYPGNTTPLNLTGGGGALYFLDPSDLVATLVATAGGAVTVLDYGADYTIGGDGTQGTGTLTMTEALAAGVLTVRRQTPRVQDYLWQEGDGNPSARFGAAEDYDRVIDQEVAEVVSRALVAPDYDAPLSMVVPPALLRAGFLLKWDAITGAPENSTFTEEGMAAAISLLLGTRPPAGVSKIFYLSAGIAAGLTLAQLDTMCTAGGGTLVIDCGYVLPASVSLTSKEVIFLGGIIIKGNFDLTGNSNALVAPDVQIFVQNGTGRLKGTFNAPYISPAWWNDGTGATNDTLSVQAAVSHVNQSARTHAVISLHSKEAWFINATITSTSPDQPQIVAKISDGAGYLGPDAVNIFATCTPIFKIVGGTAPCGGSIKGFYFDSAPGAGYTSVEVNDAIGMHLDNEPSPNIARQYYLNNLSGGYSENTVIRDVVAGLGANAIFLETAPDTGTDSFSGLDIDVDITLAAGNRTGFPVFKFDAASFAYNGRFSYFIHNGATNTVIVSKSTNTPPMWFASGDWRIETNDSCPLAVNDPAASVLYFGGTGPFVQGATLDVSVDISNVIYCESFAYQPGGTIVTKGARAYRQPFSGLANAGIELVAPFGAQVADWAGTISNSDNTYSSQFSFTTVVNTGGAINGTTGNELYSTSPDTHAYGDPTVAMDASHRPKLSKAGWPAATFTGTFSVRQRL